jgi:hypothetical protein
MDGRRLMGDEAEGALASLPRESPPPEIVLAAVRAFRYRALATVAVLVTVVLVGGWVARSVFGFRPVEVRAAQARYSGGVQSLDAASVIQGVTVIVPDVAFDGRGHAYFEVLAMDPQRRAVAIDITSVRIAGRPAALLDYSGIADAMFSQLWQEVEVPGSRLSPIEVNVRLSGPGGLLGLAVLRSNGEASL